MSNSKEMMQTEQTQSNIDKVNGPYFMKLDLNINSVAHKNHTEFGTQSLHTF